ncbi:DUF2752 domain-containing protein [Flavobacterium kingsejongi]|uniref:DUF2752 domain-containing protein n=1 Tax=Flavobacterium kingsejongi TaxID=1678728 RepID=A0A2S1LSA3_9FLAO|nr:DUF2752 domain-containing protein [Flavobacterium kingsejongi]AWG26568.1 hypothetical protein FK004_15715 [Flavobacterium kingsejongi]
MALEYYMIPCMNKKLFGVDCMGCGIQRSFLLIIRGDFSAAFHMYPPIYTLLLFFGVLGLSFIDKSRSYHNLIIGSAVLNGIAMVMAYTYKMFFI